MPDLSDVEKAWREQGLKADLPSELYEAIVPESSGFDKRVVRNIAFHSVLFDESGQVIDWQGIMNQWSLKRIQYGKHSRCAICDRFPIVEHCILINGESEHEITVGNSCVLRFMEGSIDGESPDEKKQFIRENLKEDARRLRIEKFKFEFPTFWHDFKQYEEVLQEYRPALLNSILKRMVKHNHLTKALKEEWREFLSMADSLSSRMAQENDDRIMRQNALRERQNQIAILRQQELKQLRERRKEIAKSLLDEFEHLTKFASDDEIEILSESLSNVRNGGLPNRKASTVYEELKSRQAIHQDGSGITDAEQGWLHALDELLLTKGERLFRYRVIAKPKISNADRSAIRRMKSRYGTHQT